MIMKKKEYIRPRLKVENIDLNQIIAVSLGISDDDASENSPSKHFSIWNSVTDNDSKTTDDTDESLDNF